MAAAVGIVMYDVLFVPENMFQISIVNFINRKIFVCMKSMGVRRRGATIYQTTEQFGNSSSRSDANVSSRKVI